MEKFDFEYYRKQEYNLTYSSIDCERIFVENFRNEIFFISKFDNESPQIIVDLETKVFDFDEINHGIDASSRYRIAAQDEVDWLEYCELHGKFYEQDYTLEHSEPRLLREFIRIYL